MIGALLSNTPANLLRSSGVAGERDPGTGADAFGRDRDSARNSLASASFQSVRKNNSPVLTAEAVLALQDAESAETAKRGATNSQSQGADEETDGSTEGQISAAGTGAASGQPGQGPAQAQAGADDKEDPDGDGLNEAEEKQVQELAKRDREVRAHEQAHARVGGPYAGAPSYTFQQGPDGKRYAIGGEVQIDTGKEKTPQETIRKMQVVIRAALAPAEPSSQDLKVAQLARSQLSEAQAEARQERADELKGGDEDAAKVSDVGNNGGATDTRQSASQDGENGSGLGARNSEASTAYQSALQRVNEAEALVASIVA